MKKMIGKIKYKTVETSEYEKEQDRNKRNEEFIIKVDKLRKEINDIENIIRCLNREDLNDISISRSLSAVEVAWNSERSLVIAHIDLKLAPLIISTLLIKKLELEREINKLILEYNPNAE